MCAFHNNVASYILCHAYTLYNDIKNDNDLLLLYTPICIHCHGCNEIMPCAMQYYTIRMIIMIAVIKLTAAAKLLLFML